MPAFALSRSHLGLPAAVAQFDYYIDTAALPGGDGRTPSTAFNSIAAFEAAVTPYIGMKVGFKYGSEFRGLGESIEWTSNHPSSYAAGIGYLLLGAYGDPRDGLPKFDASDDVAIADMTVVGDGTTKFTKTTLAQIGDCILNMWEKDTDGNERFLKRVPDLATCQSTEGTFFAAADAGTVDFYFHPYGSTDPTTDGKTYSWPARYSAVAISGAHSTVRNLWGLKAYGSGEGIKINPAYCIADGVRASFGSKHNIIGGPGSIVRNSMFDGFGYFAVGAPGDYGSSNPIVFFGDDGLSAGAIIENCRVVVTPDSFFGVSSCTYGHCNAGDFGVITLKNNDFLNLCTDFALSGFAFANFTTANLSGNRYVNFTNAISGAGAVGQTVNATGERIYRNRSLLGTPGDVSASTGTTNVQSCFFCLTGDAVQQGSPLRFNGNDMTFVVQFNKFYFDGTANFQGSIISQGADYTGMHFTFTDNVAQSPNFPLGGAMAIGWGANRVTIDAQDRNIYDVNTGRALDINGTTYTDIAAVRAALNLELNSSQTGADASAATEYVYVGFKPSDIAGCQLWLDGADPAAVVVSGGKVTTWKDKSGNANHAVQATAALQPLYDGQVGFGAAVHFDRAVGNSLTTGASVPLASGSEILVVGRALTVDATHGAILRTPLGFAQEFNDGSNDLVQFYDNDSLVVEPAELKKPFILDIQYAGATSKLVLNGGSASGDLGSADLSGNMSFGDNTAGSQLMDGNEAEVLVFDHVLSAAERAQVVDYLYEKWGLGPAYGGAALAA